MAYEFSELEINEITRKYPNLRLEKEDDILIWKGEINFDSVYKGYRIIDSFQCNIFILPNYPAKIPLFQEIGGRTEKIAEKWQIEDLRDLHCAPKYHVACLCVRQEEKIKFPQGSSLLDFIDKLALPYLFALAYFEDYGKWPWKTYSHGVLGILEYYGNNEVKLNIDEIIKDFRQDKYWRKYRKYLMKWQDTRLCICGSKKLFSECHSEAWSGLKKINKHIIKSGLNPYKLFQLASKNLLKINDKIS